MYSFKEKKKHLEELSNKEAAEADLLLLKQAQPTFHSLRTFERNPKRYAQDILYALLDFRTRDEIRMHRRKYINKEEQAELAPKVEQPDSEDEKHSSPEEKSLSEDKQPDSEDEKHSSPEEKSASEDEQPENKVVPDPDGELENVKEQLQEAIDRAELAEEEKESLQEKLECEQEAREQAEQTLEKEKKKSRRSQGKRRIPFPKSPKARRIPKNRLG